MEVQLTPTQETELADLASKTGQGKDELVREAVERLLAHNRWFQQQVQVGLDQIARGEFVEDDEMHSRIEQMFPS